MRGLERRIQKGDKRSLGDYLNYRSGKEGGIEKEKTQKGAYLKNEGGTYEKGGIKIKEYVGSKIKKKGFGRKARKENC